MFERAVTSFFTDEIEVARDRYVDLLGFRVDLDLGWFVSLRHDDHDDLEVALTSADHESIPAARRNPARGVALAVVVDDVDAFHRRLRDEKIPILQDPVDHPWGQRQVMANIHDQVVLDVIQVTTPDPEWMVANGLA